MKPDRLKILENRIERLEKENRKLRERHSATRKENQSLHRTLRNTRRLMDKIPGPVILLQDENVLFANEAARRASGYTEKELIGKNFLDFVHPDEAEIIRKRYQKRISGKAVPSCYETRFITGKKAALHCEVRVAKVRYGPRRAFLLYITPLDRRMEEMKRLRRACRKEIIPRMAAGLQRRLEPILEMLDEHGRRPPDPGNVSPVAARTRAAGEMGRFLGKQLDCLARERYARSERVPVDLRTVVKDAVRLTRPAWTGRGPGHGGTGITVKTYLRALSPVRGHPREIRDLFVIMILNAVGALPEGGRLYITTEENAGFAHVYLQDSGKGIPDGARDRMFDPFFSVAGRKAADLDLSLADAIVARHGGDIEVAGDQAQGATFLVRLPLDRPAAAPVNNRSGKKLRDSHILLVTDEEPAGDLLGRLLADKGARVSRVWNLTGGLKQLTRNAIDLVIADVRALGPAPGKGISRIRHAAGSPPVAVINAARGQEVLKRLMEQGADLVASKPLDMDRVCSRVTRLLARGREPG